MISKVRDSVISKMNKKLHFRFNGSRNQIEEFNGIISEVYNYVFIIRISDNELKCFSYNDVLIGNLEILS